MYAAQNNINEAAQCIIMIKINESSKQRLTQYQTGQEMFVCAKVSFSLLIFSLYIKLFY